MAAQFDETDDGKQADSNVNVNIEIVDNNDLLAIDTKYGKIMKINYDCNYNNIKLSFEQYYTLKQLKESGFVFLKSEQQLSKAKNFIIAAIRNTDGTISCQTSVTKNQTAKGDEYYLIIDMKKEDEFISLEIMLIVNQKKSEIDVLRETVEHLRYKLDNTEAKLAKMEEKMNNIQRIQNITVCKINEEKVENTENSNNNKLTHNAIIGEWGTTYTRNKPIVWNTCTVSSRQIIGTYIHFSNDLKYISFKKKGIYRISIYCWVKVKNETDIAFIYFQRKGSDDFDAECSMPMQFYGLPRASYRSGNLEILHQINDSNVNRQYFVFHDGEACFAEGDEHWYWKKAHQPCRIIIQYMSE